MRENASVFPSPDMTDPYPTAAEREEEGCLDRRRQWSGSEGEGGRRRVLRHNYDDISWHGRRRRKKDFVALAAKGQDSKKLLPPSFSSNVHPGEGREKRNLVSLSR